MNDLYGLSVGDRVQVFDINGPRYGQPKGGWDGEVVKVGRKLVTVTYAGNPGKAFRMDTGAANDAYGHAHIRTVEQAAESLRRSELAKRLKEHGLTIDHYHGPSISTDALAAVVEVLDRSGSGETEKP